MKSKRLKLFPGFLILNSDPHKVLSQDRFTWKRSRALIQDIVLIANRVEVGKQKLFAAGLRCYLSGQGWREMTFAFPPIRKGAFENKKVHPKTQIDDVFTIIGITGNCKGLPIFEIDPVSDAFWKMSHRFGRDAQIP